MPRRFLAATAPAVLISAILMSSTAPVDATPSSPSHTENNIMTPHPQTIPQTVSRFMPETHVQVSQRDVEVDGKAATLTRYERRDGRNAGLEGEHFSTVIARDGTLKGFANTSMDLVGKPLPTRERSVQIARDFLRDMAPDLLPRMKISWIEPHDEPILMQGEGGGETVTLTGMKVKARNLADGLWFWVIVGSDEKPMVFERDIEWVTFPGHRKTEKWLHDGWLKARAAG